MHISHQGTEEFYACCNAPLADCTTLSPKRITASSAILCALKIEFTTEKIIPAFVFEKEWEDGVKEIAVQQKEGLRVEEERKKNETESISLKIPRRWSAVL